MFAVLKTGGKQYRVQQGDILRVEKLNVAAGDKVQFNDILMVGSTIGSPLVAGAAVQAEVIEQIKADKVITFHKRRRKHSSQRTRGHRQQLTLLRVTEVLEAGAETSGIAIATGTRAARRAGTDDVTRAAAAANGLSAAEARRSKPAAPKAEAAPKAAAPKAAPKAAKAKAPAKAEPETAAETPKGTRPANLLDAARDSGADDLKLIVGVGPKLEELLNQNGVYHFDQIAAWTPAEVEYMDDQMSFPGRIDREEWIKQAAELAKTTKEA